MQLCRHMDTNMACECSSKIKCQRTSANPCLGEAGYTAVLKQWRALHPLRSWAELLGPRLAKALEPTAVVGE